MSDPSAQQPVAGMDPAKAPIQGEEWRGSNEAIVPAKAGSDIFFAAVKTTRMPMVVTDPHQPDNPIIFCNDAFSSLTGYAQDEILGYNCRFLQGPETDRTVIDQIRGAIARREEIAVEVLNYRKNGSTFWNALFVSPVFDDALLGEDNDDDDWW